MKKIAIIIAGGSGSRMGQDIPKQFLNVNEKPVILYTLQAFQDHPNIDAIIVVCLEGWHEILKAYAKQFGINKLVSVVNGGDCGQASIKNGLIEAKKKFSLNDIILIHDAIRPMVSKNIISDCIVKCEQYGNATAVVPCTTVVLERNEKEYAENTVDRDTLYLSQTPQAFILKDILSVHKEAEGKGIFNSLASCSLYTTLGRKVYYSLGDETNIKLTRTGDLQIFKALLSVKNDDWIKE